MPPSLWNGPLLVIGRTRHQQDPACRGSRPRPRPPLFQWHIVDHQGRSGAPRDTPPSRLRGFATGRPAVEDIAHAIVRGALANLESEAPAVVLIDEIDKADIEFPNDLLRELTAWSFIVVELARTVVARHRPLFIITSKQRRRNCPTPSCAAASTTSASS